MVYYSTDTAWGNWSGTSSTITSNSVWYSWTSYSTSSCTCSDTAWIKWTSSGTSTTSDYTVTIQDGSWVVWASEAETARETREQRRAREAQAEINRISAEQKYKEMEEAKAQAELKAQELLKDLLTEDEMEVYQKTGRVLVRGKKHDYLLVKGHQADVIQVEKGKIIDLKTHKAKVKGKSYCVLPIDNHKLPDTDKVISMKVALESEEDSIMKVANRRGDREVDLAVNM